MKQKLAIARALIHNPQVLFLDEPTANLDPEASKMVRDFVLVLKKEKRTIFLNTHMLDEADRICDRVGILRTKLLAVGSPEDLRQSLWERRTVVQVEKVTNDLVSAVEALGLKVEVSANKLVVQVANPERENPEIIEAIHAAGGRIQFVSEVNPTLEDVYMRLAKGAK